MCECCCFLHVCSWAWMLMRLVLIQNHCVGLFVGIVELLIFLSICWCYFYNAHK